MSFKDININFNYRSDENDITRDFYIWREKGVRFACGRKGK